jgi:aminocarboxymuconate-semialdehyde decarboxylase
MLGSDHPFVSSTSVDYIFATTTLSDDEKVAILGGNAAKLLGIKA